MNLLNVYPSFARRECFNSEEILTNTQPLTSKVCVQLGNGYTFLALFDVTMKSRSFASGHKGLCLAECAPLVALAPSPVNTILAPCSYVLLVTGGKIYLPQLCFSPGARDTKGEHRCCIQRLSSAPKKIRKKSVSSAGELQAGMAPGLRLSGA